MTLSRFISLWTHPDSVPDTVGASDLEDLERRLETQLPLDYRDAILQFGLPRPTIELLDAICDRELDLSDVSDFLDPKEIVQVTEEWRELGLPEELFAFATDCMGNLFCFPTDTNSGREQPVFFWDHDSKQVETVASSFTRWIEDYCRLSPN
jgi:hypothetical protein